MEVATGVGEGLCDSSARDAVMEPSIRLDAKRATVTIFFVFILFLLEKLGHVALQGTFSADCVEILRKFSTEFAELAVTWMEVDHCQIRQ